MRKTMYKSVLAVIAAGLLSVGMATAETLDTPDTTDQAGSTKTLKLGHNFKNVEPRMDTLQWHFHDWPIENTQKAHTFKGQLKEAVQKLPYEVEAPSYIPYGYDVPYVPAEYKDFEWSEQGESGEVFYTGDPAAQLIRSITWTKDGMAYSLLFLESVKSVDAEFYKEHVEPVNYTAI